MSRRIPWIAMGLTGAGMLARLGFEGVQRGLLNPPPCPLKVLTGLSCASCGLTRWALALGRGAWWEALRLHPTASLLLVLAPGVLVWDLHRAARNRPYPALPEAAWVRWSAATAFLLAWLIQAVRGI